LKITIKNPAPRGQPKEQGDVHAKFIKPKSPEVGKWKINEVKAQRKQIKPTFDMLMSKYANQVTSSNSNQSSHVKCPWSPPRERYPRHSRPYGQWVPGPWMVPPPYAPYYYNGGWM
jgi:hypothetical protein